MYGNIFYHTRTSTIHWSEYDEEGRRHEKNKKWVPDFYVESKDPSKITSQDGKYLRRVVEQTYGKRRSKITEFRDIGLKTYGSDFTPELKFILEQWPNDISSTVGVWTAFLDIETEAEQGFPNEEEAHERITLITVYSTKNGKFYVWGLDTSYSKCVKDRYLDRDDVVYVHCDNEEELLQKWIVFMDRERHDIWTGWNSTGFDIPYLFNRVCRVLDGTDPKQHGQLLRLAKRCGPDEQDEKADINAQIRDIEKNWDWVKKLSPYGIVSRKVAMKKDPMTKQMKENMYYTIEGITDYDYMELDKQFHQGKRDSYKLDDVAFDIVGERKLEYEGTIKEFYRNNWETFVDYNIQDVALLVKMDKSEGYIGQAVSLSYKCHCRFQDNFGTVKKVETAIYNFLFKNNMIIDDGSVSEEGRKIPGAYVTPEKELRRGFHHWVIDVDIASLYPSLMRGINISYDTKIAELKCSGYILDLKDHEKVTVVPAKGGQEKTFTAKQVRALLKSKNYHVAANNVIYEDIEKKRGILVQMLDMWYDQRKADKKIQAEQRDKAIEYFMSIEGDGDTEGGHEVTEKIDDVKITKYLSHEQKEIYDEYMRLSGIHYNLQWSCKILLNSVYGCLASRFFRYYDREIATSVTSSGQVVIKANGVMLNDYFNEGVFEHNVVKKKFTIDKTIEDTEVKLYSDTDSSIFSTKIRTNKGIFQIGDLYDMFENKNKHISQYGHEIVDVSNENLKCLTYNEKTKKAEFGKIKKLVRHKVTKKKWRIRVDGKEVIITEDHCAMVKRDGVLLRVKPKEINKKTDKIITIFSVNKKMAEVKEHSDYDIECIGEFEDEYVYDIEMSEDTNHTFFANDILIHNSVYLTFDKMMDKLQVPHDDHERLKVTKFLAKLAMIELEKYNENFFPQKFLAKNSIFWDQELIARTCIWSKPKKYVCYILEEDGKPPKNDMLKKGLDIVRSSIPRKFKGKITEAVDMMLKGKTEKEVCDFITAVYKDFTKWSTKEIAIPSSCNNLDKFSCRGYNFMDGTPQHMKGALAYNHLLKEKELLDYEPIKERTKFSMIFLGKNPSYPIETLGFADRLPKELDVEQYIDKNKHFERGMKKPLEQLFGAVKWRFPETKLATEDIDDLFE
jgi:DNA polymerase elongation subunit (family B)